MGEKGCIRINIEKTSDNLRLVNTYLLYPISVRNRNTSIYESVVYSHREKDGVRSAQFYSSLVAERLRSAKFVG